ncbi:aldo/keto reductase [Tuwongella immobilis]|uniref:NADP-dependent oxidoreductase domain-containing protein n=1 Tax=Tuwongella immobilis TaxID=692036 RepID=A0A6C2YHJ2_9BACT|nr:aldo/keto reductase [Tuwongella immobilis]VIP00887.1 L-galactose dehydrogenase OS=Zea mays GN=GalDH PE=2 SV=1: Aldo_ket_red [Tuwongella immobilis]VTR97192.1 L-galactose dehydrogenase OS=Zea mays GN=GalDH PE=2 SV=1: Aldo_ket_red [Tuwongella immobilis]
MSMPMRELGRTGLRVSILSQGGAAFGEQYGSVTLEQARATVQRGIDAGINLIDTSPYYGMTRSESVLGEILAGGLRDRVLICTKAGRYGVDQFDFSAKRITTSLDESLQRLRTDHVDILIAHDIEFADNFEQVFTETADALHRLKQTGKCRFIGMSGYPLGILRQAVERCSLDVVISYAHCTLQSTRLIHDLLPVADAHGVGILNGSPLSLGLLTQQGPPPWHPAPAALKAAAQKASEFCRGNGIDLSYLGMQFCLAEHRVASTITGTAQVPELEVNLRAVGQVPDLKLVEGVKSIFREAGFLDYAWESGRWRDSETGAPSVV